MSGLGASAGIGPDEAVGKVAQAELRWDAARADQEVAAYRAWVTRYQPRVLATERAAGSS